MSPAAILATQLREALAANTIGGRADDESKVRAAEHEIRQLQTSWAQVGFVPEAQARPLALRFQRACQRFFDQREQRRRALAGKLRALGLAAARLMHTITSRATGRCPHGCAARRIALQPWLHAVSASAR